MNHLVAFSAIGYVLACSGDCLGFKKQGSLKLSTSKPGRQEKPLLLISLFMYSQLTNWLV